MSRSGRSTPLTRLRMHDLLLKIHAAEPTTILLVTHDVEEALYHRTPPRAAPADAGQLGARAPTTTNPSPRTISVRRLRPRDRADRGLADLRADLLEGLGVDTHHTHRITRSPDEHHHTPNHPRDRDRPGR